MDKFIKLFLICMMFISNVEAIEFSESIKFSGSGYHESYYSGYAKSDINFYLYIHNKYGSTRYDFGQCMDFAKVAGKYFEDNNYTVLYAYGHNHAWILIKEHGTDNYLAFDYTENYLTDEVYYNPEEIYYSFNDLNNSIFRYKEVLT
jgi:hypothetical protein